MQFFLFIPFLLQGICMGFDEIYFHYKRGLPKWERIGHPLDTFSVMLCFYFSLFASFTPFTLKIFIILSIVSCIMVTKDEFVHKHFCPAAENWLHALLFTLHPMILFEIGLFWAKIHQADLFPWILNWMPTNTTLKFFLVSQTILITFFFFYQVIFWNFIQKNKISVKY